MIETVHAAGATVRTALIPAAGWGTRSLPASKAVPKEMLPIVDKPLIQYAVEEAFAAGVERVVLVLSPGKQSLVNHFQRQDTLVRELEAKGKTEALTRLAASDLPDGCLLVVTQQEPLGLGHAISCARHVIDGEPFAVLLPDDLVLADTPVLKQMIQAYSYNGQGGHMIAVQNVQPNDVDKYGIIDPGGPVDDRATVAIRGMVEKPSPMDAPSTLAVIGRYILDSSIFQALEHQAPGAGGEIQLTDAIARGIGSMPVNGFRFEGTRFDCGNPSGFIRANIAFGLQREDIAPAIRGMLAPIPRWQDAAD